jgi:hypothetical protein
MITNSYKFRNLAQTVTSEEANFFRLEEGLAVRLLRNERAVSYNSSDLVIKSASTHTAINNTEVFVMSIFTCKSQGLFSFLNLG